MQDFIIVSAYTKETPYELIIKNLEDDCKKINLPFDFLAYASTGSWVENTMLKPKLIIELLEKNKSKFKNIVWVDADARIMSEPKYFMQLSKEQIDFSVFQMGSMSRVTSGTIFIKNKENVIKFITEWKTRCSTDLERRGDQHILRKLIKDNGYQKYKIIFKSLPYSYCYVFDDSLRKLAPNIKSIEGLPVIKHMQASRKNK